MANWEDLINGLVFEAGGAIAVLFNIFKLRKDKKVRGVSLVSITFFSLWGIWNIFYYYGLQQYLSWIAGICLSSLNMIWLIMLFYYSKKEKKKLLGNSN